MLTFLDVILATWLRINNYMAVFINEIGNVYFKPFKGNLFLRV